MKPIDESIVSFVEECQIASVCFTDSNGAPYCINCFYAFDAQTGTLIFKSSPGTHHHSLIKDSGKVGGTILPNEINTLKIKGLQFQGEIVAKDMVSSQQHSAAYYKKYPFALAMPGYIWAVSLNAMKLTDNTLVFGKKLKWEK